MGPGPNATWLLESVASQGIGTATGDHSWRLIGQMFGRIDYIRFQRNLVPYMITIIDLADLPSTEGH